LGALKNIYCDTLLAGLAERNGEGKNTHGSGRGGDLSEKDQKGERKASQRQGER